MGSSGSAKPWSSSDTWKSSPRKGKGKGKGKRKGPASFDSDFWVSKKEEENRVELDGSFSGTVAKYIYKQGWGFILPDSPDSLPDDVRKMMKDAHAKAVEAGKNAGDENWLYFRKPDVDQELFPLKPETAVNFEVYTDDKGCGARNITAA